jgi:hypothetical protein
LKYTSEDRFIAAGQAIHGERASTILGFVQPPGPTFPDAVIVRERPKGVAI